MRDDRDNTGWDLYERVSFIPSLERGMSGSPTHSAIAELSALTTRIVSQLGGSLDDVKHDRPNLFLNYIRPSSISFIFTNYVFLRDNLSMWNYLERLIWDSHVRNAGLST